MPDLTKLHYEQQKKEERAARSINDEAEIDRNIWKIAGMGAVSTGFSLLLSFLVKDYFFEPHTLNLSNVQYVIFIGSAALFFGIFFFLQAILVRGLGRLHWLVFLNVLALGAFFYDRMSMMLLSGMVILYFLAFYAAYSGWKELQLLLRIKFFRIGLRVIPKIMTVIALFIAFILYLNIAEGRTNILTKNVLDELIFKPTDALIVKFIPQFSFDAPAEEVIENFAQAQIEKNPEAAMLPVSIKQNLVERSVENMKYQIEQFAKTNIDFKRTVGDALYDLLIRFLISGSETSKLITAATVAILAFLILKTIGFVLSYIILILSFIIFEVLISLQFANIILESRTREVVILK